MLIVDCGSKRTPLIIDQVIALGHRPCVVTLDFLQRSHLVGMPGFIFTGSSRMLSDARKEFFDTYAFLRGADIPLFGICFGHQFIGGLYGATICQGKYITGMREVWLENDPLFAGVEAVTPFLQDHREHISLPNDFVCLASSDLTSVEAMRHRTKPVYSVQFHPEVSGDVGFKLIENFVKCCLERMSLQRN